jgi:hypothetical protein
MYTKLFVATAVALSAMGTFAHADDDAALTGAAGGAVTGAVIGGPVGAVIGGAVGLTAGAALQKPPREVITYVEEQPIPEDTIVIQQPIVVGKPLPSNVTVQPVPSNERFAYAVVNKQRVIVDPQTNTVIQVVE